MVLNFMATRTAGCLRSCWQCLSGSRRFASQTWSSESLWHNPKEWVDEPQFPEIVPRRDTPEHVRWSRLRTAKEIAGSSSLKEKRDLILRQFPDLSDNPYKMKRKDSLEKKLALIWQLGSFPPSYNALPFIQYVTKTHVDKYSSPVIDAYYKDVDDRFQVERRIDAIASQVEEQLLLTRRSEICEKIDQYPGIAYRPPSNDYVADTASLIDGVLRSITLLFAADAPHLRQCQVSKDCRIEAFWLRSGFERPSADDFPDPPTWFQKPSWDVISYLRVDDGDRYARQIGFFDELPSSTELNFQSRCRNARMLHYDTPINPPLLRADPLCATPIEPVVFDPNIFGYECERKQPSWVPGSTVGAPFPFASTTIKVLTPEFRERDKQWAVDSGSHSDDLQEALHAQVVLDSFSQCAAQAFRMGFTTLNELTYPITTQSIVTDGQLWQFAVYQLNTTALWQMDSDNPTCNVAWLSPIMTLYDNIEIREDGSRAKVEGLNRDVIRQLARCVIAKPATIEQLAVDDLRPFLPYCEDEESLQMEADAPLFMESVTRVSTRRWFSLVRPRYRVRHQTPYKGNRFRALRRLGLDITYKQTGIPLPSRSSVQSRSSVPADVSS